MKRSFTAHSEMALMYPYVTECATQSEIITGDLTVYMRYILAPDSNLWRTVDMGVFQLH